jgi:pimeloyl-ACP methyl ester carboxylesterase
LERTTWFRDCSSLSIPVVAKVQVGSSEESLHAVYVPSADPTDKTIVLVNSLMTNYKMWRHVWDRLAKTHNVIMYDQRGHGGSFIPSTKCKLQDLADDVPKILQHFNIAKAHAIIGVSQGGATTLHVALKYPDIASKFIACDTQAKSPEANTKAWDDRIALARAEGMGALAQATIPRWFANDSLDQERDGTWLHEGVTTTPVEGFASSAGALQGYDLLSLGLVDALAKRGKNEVLLVAGEFDGALPKGLQALAEEVNAKKADAVQVEIIPGGGHLPMVNRATEWTDKVLEFLKD